MVNGEEMMKILLPDKKEHPMYNEKIKISGTHIEEKRLGIFDTQSTY